MMDREAEELALRILEAVSPSRGIRKNLSLLADSVRALTGSSCSVVLVAARENQVFWEYSRTDGKESLSAPRRAPYRLNEDIDELREGWQETPAGWKLGKRLDDEAFLVIKMKRDSAAGNLDVMCSIIDRVLAVILKDYREERTRQECEERRLAEGMARTVSVVVDRRKSFGLLAALICKALNAERASVLSYSEKEDALRVEAAYGKLKGPISSTSFIRPGQGVAGWCLLHGRPANLTDAPSDPRYLAGNYDDISNMLCVPVMEGDRPLGALCAVNRLEADSSYLPGFEHIEQLFLERLAGETSILFKESEN